MGEPQRRPGVDARGDVDLVRDVLGDPALATTRRARRGDDLAESAATRARARRDHLAEEALTDPLDLSRPVALAAAHRFRVLTGARAVAGVAADRQLELDIDLIAEHGLDEVDVDDDLDVLTAGRTGRSTLTTAERAAATATPEEGLEDVAETTTEEVLGRGSATSCAADTRLTELVVAGALAVVGQHLVGAGDFLEAGFGFGVAGVRVGMPFPGALAVCLLDLVRRCGA